MSRVALCQANRRRSATSGIATGFVFLWAFLDKTFGLGYSTPCCSADNDADRRRSRSPKWMSDRELLHRPEDLELLRAVAAGRVVRGADSGGQTSLFAPHYLEGR